MAPVEYCDAEEGDGDGGGTGDSGEGPNGDDEKEAGCGRPTLLGCCGEENGPTCSCGALDPPPCAHPEPSDTSTRPQDRLSGLAGEGGGV